MPMRTLSLVVSLVTVCVLPIAASAADMDEDTKNAESGKKSAVEKATQEKARPLTAAEKAKRAAEEAATKAAEEALRKKVAKNIDSIVDGLKVSRVQRGKVRALTGEMQWKLAVENFKTTRGEEIHEHAHSIVPKTIPGLMQKFMPSYMRSRIMASRRKGRRGPPSRAEITQIQKAARTKIEPQMRKTVMPALDKLKEDRIAQLTRDEKVMTRVVADRIIKVNVLGANWTRLHAVVHTDKQRESIGSQS